VARLSKGRGDEALSLLRRTVLSPACKLAGDNTRASNAAAVIVITPLRVDDLACLRIRLPTTVGSGPLLYKRLLKLSMERVLDRLVRLDIMSAPPCCGLDDSSVPERDTIPFVCLFGGRKDGAHEVAPKLPV
jgi:hypothetical protein